MRAHTHTHGTHICSGVTIKSAYWSSTPAEGEFGGILQWIVRDSGLIQQTNEAWAVWRAHNPHSHTHTHTHTFYPYAPRLDTQARNIHTHARAHTHTYKYMQASAQCTVTPSKGMELLNYCEAASCVSRGKGRKGRQGQSTGLTWSNMCARTPHTHTHTHRHTRYLRQSGKRAVVVKSFKLLPESVRWLIGSVLHTHPRSW